MLSGSLSISHGILVGAAALLLAAASAVFSGMETVLFSLSPFHLRKLQRRSRVLADTIDLLLERPRHALALILLADALANVPLVILCVHLLQNLRLPDAPSAWIKGFAIFAVVVLLCDLLPKTLGLGQAHRLARPALAILRLLQFALEPAARLLAEAEVHLARGRAAAAAGHLSEGELEAMVEQAAEHGAFNAAESTMIHRVIRLGDRVAKDLITPRVDLFALPDDLPNDRVIGLGRERRHRRIPIYDENPDHIVGILDLRRLFAESDTPYILLMDPPSFVPETLNALSLLRSFLTHPQRMAVVLDEFGGTEGVVTLDDLIEEILGDAGPGEEGALDAEAIGEGRWLVSGQARLDELSEWLGVDLQHPGIDTIGGLIFNRLGHLPKPGATLTLGRHVITIRSVTRRRVREVLVEPRPASIPSPP